MNWNETNFAELVDSYGADARRWPKELRLSALAYAETNLAAHMAILDARQLDCALDTAAPTMVDEAFVERLYALTRQRQTPQYTPTTSHWAGGMALAASLLLGFVVGTTHANGNTNYNDASYVKSLVFASAVATENN